MPSARNSPQHMVNFAQLIQLNRQHDRINHQQATSSTRNPEDLTNRDYSCTECYPSDRLNRIQFEHFWNWFQTIYPAVSYSEYTQEAVRNLSNQPENFQEIVPQVVASIRYSAVPESTYQEIQEDIAQACNAS